MKLSRKSLVLIVSVVLCAVMTIGGTMAYLTDSDSKVNTFTVGAVDIEVEEKYEQGSELLPNVPVQKAAKITNIGKNDAYVMMSVAVPVGANDNDAINHTVDIGENAWTKMVSQQDIKIANEAGVEQDYHLYVYLYNDILPVGASTNDLLKEIALHPQVDYNPHTGKYAMVNGGVAYDFDYDLSAGAVYVNGYAIQTTGFGSAEEAYKAYQTQWGEWDAEKITLPTVKVNTQEALQDALKDAQAGTVIELEGSNSTFTLPAPAEDGESGIPEDVSFVIPGGSQITVDLSGNTLDIVQGSDENKVSNFVVEETGNLTVKNGTISNGTSSNVGAAAVTSNGTLTLEDCTIENVSTSSGGAYALVVNAGVTTLKNCHVEGSRGAISVAKGAELIFEGGSATSTVYYPLYIAEGGKATFTNTEFVRRGTQTKGAGMIYSTLTKGNGSVTFNNCTFTNKTSKTFNLVVDNNFAGLTFNNCTYSEKINSQPVTNP